MTAAAAPAERALDPMARLWLDAAHGTLVTLDRPRGQHSGNTLDVWLRAPHFAAVPVASGRTQNVLVLLAQL